MSRATTSLASARRPFFVVFTLLTCRGASTQNWTLSAEDMARLDRRDVLNFSWFLPRAAYVFRAEYQPFERVHFSGVSGDFEENEGVWELMPRRDGAATVVTYRAHVVPRLYMPRWIALASLKRDLPALLQGLRARCETPELARKRAGARAGPIFASARGGGKMPRTFAMSISCPNPVLTVSLNDDSPP